MGAENGDGRALSGVAAVLQLPESWWFERL